MHDHHQPQFRIGGGFGLEVDGLHVDQGFAHGNRQDVAPDHVAAPLIPQAELAGEEPVLVDLGFHLLGPQHPLLLGKFVGQQAAVVVPVAHAGDPADEHLPVFGRKGLDERELGFVGPRRLPHDVIGRHRLDPVVIFFRGSHPQVLLVVEHRGIGHVVFAEHQPLHPQHVGGIPDVGAERFRHLILLLEQFGKGPGPHLDQRVVRLEDVEIHRAVEGVHHHLHAVADVVDPVQGGQLAAGGAARAGVVELDGLAGGKRLAVRVGIGGGVGVHDPEQPPFGQDHVGVGVQMQKRGDLGNPFLDFPPEQDPAAGPGIAGKDQPQPVEPPAEKKFLPESVHGNAAGPVVSVVAVLFPAGIVELLLFGIDHHRRVGQLAVVDAGLVHRQLGMAGLGRNVFHQQVRQPFRGKFADVGEREAEAVGVFEAAVDEGLALLGQIVHLQLPRGHHHLPVFAVEGVAVDVHVHELVVEPDFLELLVDRVQRPPIPQPDVFKQILVFPRRLSGKVFLKRVFPLLDLFQIEPLSGEFDVVGDVEFLEGDFVGLHPQGLKRHGQQPQRHGPEDRQQRGGGREGVEMGLLPGHAEPGQKLVKSIAKRGNQQRRAHQEGQHEDDGVGGQADVVVGPARALHRPPFGKQKLIAVEEFSDRQHADEQGGGDVEPPEAGFRRVAPSALRQRHAVFGKPDEGGDEQGDERHHRQLKDQVVTRLQQRQGKEVEAGVFFQDGIGDAGGHPVDENQHLFPLGQSPQPAGQRPDDSGPAANAGRRARFSEGQQPNEGPAEQRAQDSRADFPDDDLPESAGVAQGVEPERLDPDVEDADDQQRQNGQRRAADAGGQAPALVAEIEQGAAGDEEDQQQKIIHESSFSVAALGPMRRGSFGGFGIFVSKT